MKVVRTIAVAIFIIVFAGMSHASNLKNFI
jgi:hypothetical protein